jgi:protein TonB
MNRSRSFLGRALALSLVLHAAVIAAVALLITPARPARRPAQADLTVSMRDRLVVPDAPAQPQLLLPADAPRHAIAPATGGAARARREAPVQAAASGASRPDSPRRLTGEAALRAAEQLQRDLPYPPEAIERGLQGEALVLIFLDPSGNAIAARLESSSGHALLDDAAVRAARTLHALPASAPREALLPVRFRLR